MSRTKPLLGALLFAFLTVPQPSYALKCGDQRYTGLRPSAAADPRTPIMFEVFGVNSFAKEGQRLPYYQVHRGAALVAIRAQRFGNLVVLSPKGQWKPGVHRLRYSRAASDPGPHPTTQFTVGTRRSLPTPTRVRLVGLTDQRRSRYTARHLTLAILDPGVPVDRAALFYWRVELKRGARWQPVQGAMLRVNPIVGGLPGQVIHLGIDTGWLKCRRVPAIPHQPQVTLRVTLVRADGATWSSNSRTLALP